MHRKVTIEKNEAAERIFPIDSLKFSVANNCVESDLFTASK
ncbi:hypothetical protein VCR5J5_1370112 [Vibrio crassostreae]|uniref:Uncharacterized protein n=1 Tax=Vibrio crassostreae TaxID=246167 RepID=A0A822MNZ6_9VIBR|nr:hypothetical protein VCR5J5_1370112 [Vibrio crassostreae]